MKFWSLSFSLFRLNLKFEDQNSGHRATCAGACVRGASVALPAAMRNLPQQWGTEVSQARAFMTYCNALTAGTESLCWDAKRPTIVRKGPVAVAMFA